MYLSDSETVKQNNVKYSYLSSTEHKVIQSETLKYKDERHTHETPT